MKRVLTAVSAALLAIAMAGPAAAAPNPNERATDNDRQRACVNVLAHNPNTTEDAPNAGTPGAENFLRVGQTFCADLLP